MVTVSIPQQFQSALWSTNIHNLDVQKDKSYIIHQILAYGSLEDMIKLYSLYPQQTISDVFTSTPYKDYRKSRFYFVKDYIVHCKKLLNESAYVKNTPRSF